MLKKWNTFNESVGGKFTEEMAMEIVYYFSELSKPTKSIVEVLLSQPEMGDILQFYDSDYDDYKEATRKLYGEANRGSLEFRDTLIKVYNMIREERSAFPMVSEIEDLFLGMIDDGYSFIIYSDPYEYKIKVQNSDDNTTVDDFVKCMKSLGDNIKRLNVGPLKATLDKAERLNGFYDSPQSGRDRYTSNEFVIKLRRVGWKKVNRGFNTHWAEE